MQKSDKMKKLVILGIAIQISGLFLLGLNIGYMSKYDVDLKFVTQ